MSSEKSTLIISVQDSIDEVDGTAFGFTMDVPTIGVHRLLRHSSIIQVIPTGFIQVGLSSSGHFKRLSEWHLPSIASSPSKVVSSCSNEHQLVLLINGNQLRYFETATAAGPSHSGILKQVGPVKTVPMTISCMAMVDPAEGSLRTDFLLVACQEDCTIRLINLAQPTQSSSSSSSSSAAAHFHSKGKETKLFEMLALQMLSKPAHSMALLPSGSQTPHLQLLLIGHADGTVSRLWLDTRTGSLLVQTSNASSSNDESTDDAILLNKVFGTKPVRLLTCRQADGKDDGVIAVSGHLVHRIILHHDSRSFAGTFSDMHLSILPVILPTPSQQTDSYSMDDSSLLLASIATDSIFGLVSIRRDYLSIQSYLKTSAEALSSNGLFLSSSHSLLPGMAGKRMIQDHSTGIIAIIQSAQVSKAQESMHTYANCTAVSVPLLSKGLISFYSPHSDQILPTHLYLSDGMVPLSACFVAFHTNNPSNSNSRLHLVVGAASSDYDPLRKTASSFCLCTFAVQYSRQTELNNTQVSKALHLQFIHGTAVSHAPLALSPFHGMLLAGMGQTLALYDLGLRKLLRKCELTSEIPFCIASIATAGMRIYLSDVKDGFLFVLYRLASNEFFIFADDPFQRWLLGRPCILDADTVAGCDKFGNLLIHRLPEAVQQALDQDPTGGMLSRKPWLLGAPYKSDIAASWHMDGLSSTLEKTQLVPGGRSVLLHFGIHGDLGCFVPLVSQAEADLLRSLELAMREEPGVANWLGREHVHWRGYHQPVEGVIDGELCELYLRMPSEGKERIALVMGSNVQLIESKLEWLRTVSCF